MRKLLPNLALVGAVAACVASVGMVAIAASSFKTASDARDSAATLYQTRLEVARAQDRIAGSDLQSAVAGAREANATAVEVKRVTEKIARLLHSTRNQAKAIGAASRRGAGSVTATRRQAVAAAGHLAAISAYQRSASRSAVISNRALARILRALREMNRSFPGRS